MFPLETITFFEVPAASSEGGVLLPFRKKRLRQIDPFEDGDRKSEAPAGSIEIDGRPLSSYSSDEMARVVAFLPQFHDVPKDMTAEELVSCGRYPYQHWWSGVSTRDREVVAEVMKKTNTTHLKDRLVASLSGGERQRVWIAML